ncbi:MAG TPA: hypothetical protein VFI73_11410 [Candidatus Nitrosopolaris sp.]|nr:hypothetical protein [Candidatus Nitrosopolaris sp.]
MNIVQPINNTVTKFQETTRHGVPLPLGGSLSLTKQITDLRDDLYFSINLDSDSSSNAADLSNQPLNTTLKMTIIEPNGRIFSRDSLNGQTVTFWPFGNTTSALKPDIPGQYTFIIIKNLGNNLRISA